MHETVHVLQGLADKLLLLSDNAHLSVLCLNEPLNRQFCATLCN